MVQIIHVLPEILVRETSKRKKKRGIGAGRHGNQVTKVPAEHILDMRRRHEVERQPLLKIVRAYPQYQESYIRHILAYELRANLRVTPI